VEGGRQIGVAGAPHRRGGWAAEAVSVGVAGGVPQQQRQPDSIQVPRLLFDAWSAALLTMPS
jgi:hypothetical protein